MGPIGAFAYTMDNYPGYAGDHLYSFADLITNFTSLVMFIIIATSILGALKNRKTNRIKVKKSKTFVPFAIISIVINYVAGAYMIIESIINATGFNGADSKTGIIQILILLGLLSISIIPGIFQAQAEKKQVILQK